MGCRHESTVQAITVGKIAAVAMSKGAWKITIDIPMSPEVKRKDWARTHPINHGLIVYPFPAPLPKKKKA